MTEASHFWNPKLASTNILIVLSLKSQLLYLKSKLTYINTSKYYYKNMTGMKNINIELLFFDGKLLVIIGNLQIIVSVL